MATTYVLIILIFTLIAYELSVNYYFPIKRKPDFLTPGERRIYNYILQSGFVPFINVHADSLIERSEHISNGTNLFLDAVACNSALEPVFVVITNEHKKGFDIEKARKFCKKISLPFLVVDSKILYDDFKIAVDNLLIDIDDKRNKDLGGEEAI